MSLLNYWPTADEVNQCIKPEAEGAHDAVLLAVHQPSPLTYRSTAGGEKIKTSEDELYRYFLTPDVPTGAHVVPITGASGVGKSHLVRLLAARLLSEDVEKKYVVVRIPKYASLRRVVELILEPLPDDGYAGVKQEFKKALSEVNLDNAAISFQAQLEIALGELETDLKGQLSANLTNVSLRARLGHARALPKFMRDPMVADHFRTHVFPRIVQRAIAGQLDDKNAASVEDLSHEDFNLPPSVDLSKAAESTRVYYQTTLRANDCAGMRAAADLLNGPVVDQAMRQLFNLHEAVGGMTLQDVILEIRRLLLKDGRELVILVEDFKALTGIQDTLLHVLIQEGIRDGKAEFATMRSVIAVTEGYLAGKDTIATRAKREWFVESHLSDDEEVLQRTKQLVASYLNAARWGHARLLRHYEGRDKNWSSASAWIEPYSADDDDSDDLAPFGYADGVPLFPFTELAIERLARMSLTQNDALVFTPRFVIDNILRNILLSGREAFEEKKFPPVSIEVPPAKADVAQWLATSAGSTEQRGRYERLIAIWGNAPATRHEIGRIPAGVFRVFGLPEPGFEVPPPEPKKPVQKDAPVVEKPRRTPATEVESALENWVQNNVRLDAVVANQIRKALESAINSRIDWNAERLVKLPIAATDISIPHSSGEGRVAREQNIQIAPDNRDPDGLLRSDLIALVRFYSLNKESTDYEEVDDDLARIGNFVQRLMPDALRIIHAKADKQVRLAAKLLAVNSRLLGLLETHKTPRALSEFFFSTPQLRDKPPEGAPTEFQNWRMFQEEALRVRPRLSKLLLAGCGCFQGTADTPYGVDATRIADLYAGTEERTDLAEVDGLEPDVRQVLAAMTDAKVALRTKKVLEEAGRIERVIRDELGEAFDKNTLADCLKDLADAVQEMGLWSQDEIGYGPVQFKRLCDDFRSAGVVEAMNVLRTSVQSNQGGNEGRLTTWIARFDVAPLITANSFIKAGAKLANFARRRADLLQDQTQGISSQSQAVELRATFDGIVAALGTLESKGEKECC